MKINEGVIVMSEKLQEATMKVLTEDNKKISIKDIKGNDNPFISSYKVGKTGISIKSTFHFVSDEYNIWLDCSIMIKNTGEIVPKFEMFTSDNYTLDDVIDLDKFVEKVLDTAVKEGYIEQKAGIYIDKKETEANKAKSEFLNMIDKSDEELKSTLPGKTVQGMNSNHLWEVLGIFTAYNGKDYVAMKKKGMFNDPGLTELSRFKKSYKVID